MRHYENSVAFLGTWGRFQLMVFFLLCSTNLPNGTGSFSLVFVTDTPRHRCRIPETNLSQEWQQAAVPLEFDLVCDQHWKQPLTATIFFLGVLVGSFFSGLLSDRFGRKPVLFATIIIQATFTLLQIVAPSWQIFCFFLFCNGLGNISMYMSCYVLGTEILTGSARVVYTSTGVCLGFALGYMTLPLFAYYLRSWKTLLLAIGLPGLFFVPLWWILPESPMWLLSQGRVAEAEVIVKKAAHMNRVAVPEKIFGDSNLNVNDERPVEHYTVLDLLRKRGTALTTVLLCWDWFTLTVCYFGLSLNTSQLHSDPYISCFLSAVVEVPAYFSCSLAIRYAPRRLAVGAVFLTVGLALFFIQLVPQSMLGLAVALEMLGKFSTTCGSSLLYAYTAELYPTGLRNTGSGVCLTVSRTGSCIAPFIIRLSKNFLGQGFEDPNVEFDFVYYNICPHVDIYFKYLPYITMGTLAICSVLTTLFLPESFRRPLPETLQQIPKRKWWAFTVVIECLHIY
ncbi:solute carrier family 22 member 4-like isoform X4 [Corythoichthys intestinalis]|uniref:solute carrier family 22 member 4-like isoform X4 n=1 Tax=Corythoichthys intestinalis TaxID=161448 RepID=UPI0025A6016B|nr:solute carrier family 22 member 4-like isoform X4 [Corythoichthys intestinalis]